MTMDDESLAALRGPRRFINARGVSVFVGTGGWNPRHWSNAPVLSLSEVDFSDYRESLFIGDLDSPEIAFEEYDDES